MTRPLHFVALLALVMPGILATNVAFANTFLVSNGGTNTVGEWSSSGSVVNASLITGLNTPNGIAAWDGYVYVANQSGNTVGKYTSSGQAVDTSFITGLAAPTQLTVADGSLLVLNSTAGTIGKFDLTTGAAVNTSFITLTDCVPYSMAVSGTNLFVTAASYKNSHVGNGFVVEYSTIDGGYLADVIPTLSGVPGFFGLAANDQSLYVAAMFNNGYVSEYSLTGTLVNGKLIDNLNGPTNIMVSGSNLYVLVNHETIGQYTTSGQTVDASLITGLSFAENFTLVPVPEPSTYCMAFAGLACGGYSMLRRRKRA